ncbi:hypothetical protein FRC01_011371, partial [Tulasnella sp. 417]
MDRSTNSTDHFSRLPIDLFVPIIFLSFDTSDPVERLIRVQGLRLVNRAWRAAIDSTPLFWACIPNEPSSDPETIQGWIKKSGEASLHILSTGRCRPLGAFMPFITPHAHRWRVLELSGDSVFISRHIKKPVPRLERLDLSLVSISRDTAVFEGVHPVLSAVALRIVTLPNDIAFLNNLRDLTLQGVSGPLGTLPLSQLYQVLACSSNLEQLELDAGFIVDMPQPPPILFTYLASFRLASYINRPRCAAALLAMIHAPNVTHLDIHFHGIPIPAAFNIFSPRTVQQLRQASHLIIDMPFNTFHLSTGRENVTIKLSYYADIMEVPVKMLRETERLIPSSAAVDILIHHARHSMGVFNHLKSSGVAGHPLPGLRKVHLIVFRQYSLPYKNLVADLARARPDIAKIIVQRRPDYESEGQLLRWDTE